MALRNKKRKKEEKRGLSMRKKLFRALGSIAAILLLSGVISILEYRRMSDYVSDQISSNLKSINISQQMSDLTQQYNQQMLSVVLMNDIDDMPDFNKEFINQLSDSLRVSLTSRKALPLVDDVEASFNRFMTTSLDFEDVFLADSLDVNGWFFDTLQPQYSLFRQDINKLNDAIHNELHDNSSNFDAGFYRSIMPGVVSVAAGLLLIILLFYFIMVNYVNPICRMADGMKAYKSLGHKYTYEFEGDDQLTDLNEGVAEIIEENIEVKRRLKNLREERDISL